MLRIDTMKKNRWIVVLMAVLPWMSLPLMGKNIFKKYALAALTMSTYLVLEGRFAEKRKWWWFPYNVRPNVLAELPLIFGPFFIGSIWILKYTFGKFKLYFLVNLIIDSLFTYIGMDLFKKVGYVTLVRLTKFQLSVVFLIKTFLLYGSQLLYGSLSNHFKKN